MLLATNKVIKIQITFGTQMVYLVNETPFSKETADFIVRDSAETSAEASVDLAKASVSAESRFRAFRSFTTNE